jgi:putative transposase
MIQYKSKDYQIRVIENNESYTSGTSFLDGELPIKENYNKSRRIHRGLFQANDGRLINSDVNGALQIVRKVVPNAFADGIEGSLVPIVINLGN